VITPFVSQHGPRAGRLKYRFAALAASALPWLFATPLYPGTAPFAAGERLAYSITWPSGLSLGEAVFRAGQSGDGWSFEARIKASLPAIDIIDEYTANADAALCSSVFEKEAEHGDRKVKEKVTFDQQAHTAYRQNLPDLPGAGESTFDIPPCARDGLTFLYFLRHELAAGRVPPPDDINFGAQYMTSMTYAESLEVEVGGKRQKADRIIIDLTGPKSQRTFEIFFAHDDARTPVLMRIPFDLGTFSLRLKR
jgi:hypothetical protein